MGGIALALPVLDAMGAEVTGLTPRRFCAIYTANGMSLPRSENNLAEWSWFPSLEQNGEYVFGESTPTVQSLPQTTQLCRRLVPPQRSESRSAYLLRYVADRRSAAQSTARNL